MQPEASGFSEVCPISVDGTSSKIPLAWECESFLNLHKHDMLARLELAGF